MSTTVEMRCPAKGFRMFGKLVVMEKPQIVEGNLLEFSCDVCRKRNRDAAAVMHRFNMLGELVETVAVDANGDPCCIKDPGV